VIGKSNLGVQPVAVNADEQTDQVHPGRCQGQPVLVADEDPSALESGRRVKVRAGDVGLPDDVGMVVLEVDGAVTM
jgi:hypothetical protein